jgi:hypothetical protein
MIDKQGLVHHENWVNKIVQLYETSLVRHGLMMVGPAGSGKSTATRVLLEALSEVSDKHAMVRMNPKAITAEQMFGQNDVISGEWTHGIFSSIWAKFNDIRKHRTWIVCDGPVDAIWIENLNTVLDDNKLLTLANGDRVPMTDNVRLLFEVENLANASPATVSRAGIVYVAGTDLGYAPLVQAWLKRRMLGKTADDSGNSVAPTPPQPREAEVPVLERLYQKYIDAPGTLDWLNKNCSQAMPLSHTQIVNNLLTLVEALLADAVEQQRFYADDALERLFIYSIFWSVGALLEQDDRQKMHKFVAAIAGALMPPAAADKNETGYEFYVRLNTPTLEWARWEAPSWSYPADRFQFSTCLVPTVDSARAEFLIDRCMRKLRRPVLLIGSSGTAKTSIALQYMLGQAGAPSPLLLKKVNFSSATTAGMFQTSIEADIEKRQGKTYAPSGGRLLTVFLDDLSMPEVNKWGDQPTLEIVRQLIETGGYYFLEKDKRGDRMTIENLFFLGAMSHPGGGRNDIPNRLKRHFFCFNLTPPSQQTIDNIYGSMLRGRFAKRPELTELIPSLTRGTIELWSRMKGRMLPTPSKFHYIFNMRDLSRVFQGILHSPENVTATPATLAHLWRHECGRVFSDKLTNESDQKWYAENSIKVAAQFFPADVLREFKEGDPVFFADFQREPKIDQETGEVEEDAPKIYERVPNLGELRQRVAAALAAFNEAPPPGAKVMDLVLFRDALEHLLRISRLLSMPRGNALLVGVGGSGRQSLTRLAAYLAKHTVFQISLTRTYKLADFLEDIRRMYVMVGKEGRKVTWIFTDFEILSEDFLEYINAILATGEVAGLFPKDERDMMCSDLRGPAKKEDPSFDDTPDNLYKYFINRIRDNLHVVLCFSPANEKFAERARRFPGLISGCTINWFLRWPEEALVDVAAKFILNDKDFKVRARASCCCCCCCCCRCCCCLCRTRRSRCARVLLPVALSLRWRAAQLPCRRCSLLCARRACRSADAVPLCVRAQLDCGPEVAQEVVHHIATVHNRVVAACDEYFQRYRRSVHVTPKSYLSFIQAYKTLYLSKYSFVSTQENNVRSGLTKLRQAEKDVGKLQGELEQQQKDLAEADRAASIMIKELEEGARRAAEQKAIAKEIEDRCHADAEVINREKEQANKELEAAMPFVRNAEEAAQSINKKDIGVIMRLGTPPDLIKRIMDCVLILTNRPLEQVKMTKIKTGKETEQMFVSDSYDTQAKKMMVEKGFTQMLLDYAATEKDKINEETMEFLTPYLTVHDFTADRARTVSSAAEGLCKWVWAMHDYHNASLVVGPRLEELQIKSDLYEVAHNKLLAAQAESKKAEDEVARLEAAFSKSMADKAALEHKAKATQDKMRAANDLIQSLATEKERWGDDADRFLNDKKRLVGDCALATAFVSYAGPFNHEFRKSLIEARFLADAVKRDIPVSKQLQMTDFLVDKGTVAEWNSQGLPKDDLSIQNGILVTQASRFPLLIDPQGQALRWLLKREEANFPVWGSTTLSSPKLRDQLEFCLEEGKPLLIEGVVKDVDPMLDPVLEKNVKKKGRNLQLQLGDKVVSFDPNFRMFLITKLANPIFSPELSAKTTIIDFSVTQKGLEDQLLSRVIQQEQANLEEQRLKLTEEVNMNTIALQRLDKLLLDRLGASKTDLLDDVELIAVLADTKHKAKEVHEKIDKAAETEASINQKREQYRAVATRGSVLYFAVVDLSQVNVMYQTSLQQFLSWFDGSLVEAPKANLVAKRVQNLIEHLTFAVYVNVDRGLFEKDKLTFKLMVTTKIMLTETPQLLSADMLNLLLRGGAGIAMEGAPAKKPLEWLQDSAWTNLQALSKRLDFFRDLKTNMTTQEADWRKWYEQEAPEEPSCTIPSGFEERLASHPSGPFMRLLFLRCIREDRLRLAANVFVGAQLGEQYTQPLPTRMDKVWDVSTARAPIILLLTPGADPTSTLEELAKRKGLRIFAVSMGEGQEPHAERCIEQGMREGGWALLQNCHLGLGFMNKLDELIKKAFEEGLPSGTAGAHAPPLLLLLLLLVLALIVVLVLCRHVALLLLPVLCRSVQRGAPVALSQVLTQCSPCAASGGAKESKESKGGDKDAPKGDAGPATQPVNPAFRLWITCEPHPDFPINLLQMSMKVTNEPPRGMKAGLVRSYNTVVDEDRLVRVGDSREWRDMVYSVCFLHSVVQERRKFGPVGWCIPYEFSQADLEASLTFLERHFFASAQAAAALSWETVQYMICEVQYGGRITDDFDRVLFSTFGRSWLCPRVYEPGFTFVGSKAPAAAPAAGKKGAQAVDAGHHDFVYGVPAVSRIDDYRDYLGTLPNHDSPEIFGLHQNADLTFGANEAQYILQTIGDTQPKQGGAVGGGKSREELVMEQAQALLKTVPKGFNMDEVRAKIKKRPKAELQAVLGDAKASEKVDGLTIPLNVFLYQEIARMQAVIDNVRDTLSSLIAAIQGEIIMTSRLQAALNAVYDAKPPQSWYMDAGGALTAWVVPSLSLWFHGLIERERQLASWLNDRRPNSYWLTGFFNPQGFLTAVRQEIARRHKEEKWALDDVIPVTKVTDLTEAKVKKLTKLPDEGVYIHGLFLEGCGWDEKSRSLIESAPKELHTQLPVLHVSATTIKKAEAAGDSGKTYDCPCYTRPKRTGQAFVFTVKLPTNRAPEHWVLRGVALLCSRD